MWLNIDKMELFSNGDLAGFPSKWRKEILLNIKGISFVLTKFR